VLSRQIAPGEVRRPDAPLPKVAEAYSAMYEPSAVEVRLEP
jgi:hypothetical protein